MSEENKPKFPPGINFQPDGWGSKITEFLKKRGISAALPIIAAIILAGGVYYYYQNQVPEKTTDRPAAEEISKTSVKTDLSKLTAPETSDKSAGKEETAEPEKKSGIGDILKKPFSKNKEEAAIDDKKEPVLTEAIKESITKKAELGEGITHLARKALKEYLTDKGDTVQLSVEQKIYIEDFLKDAAGSRSLEIGEEITFSVSQIDQAVALAQDLTDTQIQNLSKYVPFVPSLNY